MTQSVCAVVLAAGSGSRFQAVAGQGQSKLLAYCNGRDGCERQVLEHVLISLQGIVDKAVLVTRPDLPQVIALARQYSCEVVQLASAGMGDSIACAVAAAPDHDAWLIVLGDMPFILPQTLRDVVASLHCDSISAPVFGGESGHPVGFGRHYGLTLQALSGDQGARRLFKEGHVQRIETDDPGVLWDVDVPEGLVFAPR
jgi:molybdenum cofactor cytidylyltransferase